MRCAGGGSGATGEMQGETPGGVQSRWRGAGGDAWGVPSHWRGMGGGRPGGSGAAGGVQGEMREGLEPLEGHRKPAWGG